LFIRCNTSLSLYLNCKFIRTTNIEYRVITTARHEAGSNPEK